MSDKVLAAKMDQFAGDMTLRVEQLNAAEWDAQAHIFDDVCQEQLDVFAAERWPAMALDRLNFYDGDRLVGGCLVMHKTAPFGLGGLAVCKWGPMLLKSNLPSAQNDYQAIVDLLVQEYAIKRRLMLSILPRAVPTEVNPALEYLRQIGFKKGAGLPFPNRYFVNVSLSDDEMRASFNQKWRKHLRDSEKNQLRFEHVGPDRMSEFNALYEAMTARKQFPDYSAYDSLNHLMDNIDPSIRPEIFMVYDDMGEAVAGAIIFVGGDTAVYLYGATNDKALPMQAGYFMHWEIMRWLARQPRVEWYDLGGTDGFLGLHQFKKGMVGKKGAITTVPPVMNYAHWLVPRILGETLFLARDVKANLGRMINNLRKKGPSDPQ
ncbi:lipid II:glycine glycyltransferase FemX [Maritalea mediterranea]|uniref:GNAT family N-acetyltransferase n=1 Tax=Maritalea mediterranea TaxID=2909667 RepID=A0ABS9EBN1_9HYPH|nr:GNAT family N-acetyltransferase [Maritalea mediterranea]MCF4098866.1 GNAT family N-acetyltransferase [Maritalea mediterranea]